MNIRRQLASIITLIITSAATLATPSLQKYTGKWHTYDEQTKKLDSIITISKKHNSYVGIISKIYTQDGHKTTDVCKNCKGKLHNKPILGMNVLHFTLSPNDKPQNCKVFDPAKGTLYHCQLALINNGSTLKVRGYIGLPIIGRSETWTRSKISNDNNIGSNPDNKKTYQRAQSIS